MEAGVSEGGPSSFEDAPLAGSSPSLSRPLISRLSASGNVTPRSPRSSAASSAASLTSSCSHPNPRPRQLVLAELTSLDDLSFPMNASKRIKFTCLSVSPRFLVVGTSTGTVYVFARYASKHRARAPSLPLHVFTTKDGAVHKLSVSPSEQLVGVGGESGRVSVLSIASSSDGGSSGGAALDSRGPPSSLVNALLHSQPGDARRPDGVRALCWSAESDLLFSAHSSGSVSLHRLASTRRPFSRSAVEVVVRLESEPVQMSFCHPLLLISTLSSSFLHDVEAKATIQVGKKLRNGRMGVCWMPSCAAESHSASTHFVVSARPNGRLWESSPAGIVYKTHQLRESSCVPVVDFVSFRANSQMKRTTNEDEISESSRAVINFSLLHPLIIDGRNHVVLSVVGSHVLVVDMDESRLLLVSDLGSVVGDFSVCGSDVFLLFAGSGALKKLSAFSPAKAVEKLLFKDAAVQAARFALCVQPVGGWSMSLLEKISSALFHAKKKEHDKLRNQLAGLVCVGKGKRNSPLEGEEESNESTPTYPHSIEILPGGVHRLLRGAGAGQASGYEDDFAFRVPSPIRLRSQSSPDETHLAVPSGKLLSKQRSLPLSVANAERVEALCKAKELLESSSPPAHSDALRTLLGLNLSNALQSVRFKPSVTVGSLAKSLAELEKAAPPPVNEFFLQRQLSKAPSSSVIRKGAKVVKAIRPGGATKKRSNEPNSNLLLKPLQCAAPRGSEDEENNLTWDDGDLLDDIDQLALSDDRVGKELERRRQKGENACEDEETASACHLCQLHLSWLSVFLFGAAVSRVKVIHDSFWEGGVPFSSQQWHLLLRARLLTPEDQKRPRRCCGRCGAAIQYTRRTIVGRRFCDGLRAEKSRVDVERIRQKVISLSNESLGEALFASRVITELKTFKNGEKRTNVEEDGDLLHQAALLTSVQLLSVQELLMAARLALGLPGLRDLVSAAGGVAEHLCDADWALVARLLSPQIPSQIVGFKIANGVMCELGMNRWLALECAAPPPPTPLSRRSLLAASPSFRRSSVLQSAVSSEPPTSWEFNAAASCLLCCLSLRCVVGGRDEGVLSLSCGHCFHSVCLGDRLGCPACARLRQRSRLSAAPSASASTTNSPSSSPIFLRR